MSTQNSTLVFESPLSEELQVMIVYPEAENYSMFESQFRTSGHAFLLHDLNTVVVDGKVVNEPWFTHDHLMVIQAHELGHYLAGHSKNSKVREYLEIEKEADWLGCMLLKDKGYHDAMILHEQEYYCRYNSTPQEDSKKFEEKLVQFIK
jgi:hypothetical protein